MGKKQIALQNEIKKQKSLQLKIMNFHLIFKAKV